MFDFLRNFFGDGADDFGGTVVPTHYEQVPDWHNGFGAGPDFSSNSGMDAWNPSTSDDWWQNNGF